MQRRKVTLLNLTEKRKTRKKETSRRGEEE
jgi:hypothetical protein